MFLLIIGSKTLQDPNLIYAALDETYRNISRFETLTIIHLNNSGKTEDFINEWVEERLKTRDRTEIKIVEAIDTTTLKEVDTAIIFLQEAEDNLEIIDHVALLEEMKTPFEKYKSHNFLPQVKQQ